MDAVEKMTQLKVTTLHNLITMPYTLTFTFNQLWRFIHPACS